MSDVLVKPSPTSRDKTRKSIYTIETDLTAEETALLDEAEEEFKANPENFISLGDFLAGKRL